MKLITCGKEKGYLMPFKEFDEAIKQRIPLLADKTIGVHFNWGGSQMAWIDFKDPDEQIEPGIFLEKSKSQSRGLNVDTKILSEALGITGTISDVSFRRKLAGNRLQQAGNDDALVSKDNLYCFIILGEPEIFWITEE
jgi:hypothetical protein